MTFATRPHFGLGSVAAPGPVASLGSIELGGATPSSLSKIASLTLNPNGTISYVNQMADPEYSVVPANWYAPTTTAVGAGYRVRFSLQTGVAWDVGLTNGAFYKLDVARTLTWTLAPTTTRTAYVLIEITADGSGVVLGSGMLHIDLISDY